MATECGTCDCELAQQANVAVVQQTVCVTAMKLTSHFDARITDADCDWMMMGLDWADTSNIAKRITLNEAITWYYGINSSVNIPPGVARVASIYLQFIEAASADRKASSFGWRCGGWWHSTFMHGPLLASLTTWSMCEPVTCQAISRCSWSIVRILLSRRRWRLSQCTK